MRLLVILIVILFASLSITGCGGSSTKSAEPEKGSLMRTFKLVDDQGRESGTLTINPQGGAELRDSDSKVIGNFIPQQAVQTPVEKPGEEVPAHTKDANPSDQDDDDEKDK